MSDKLRLKCPACAHLIDITGIAAGRQILCPKCEKLCTVPDQKTARRHRPESAPPAGEAPAKPASGVRPPSSVRPPEGAGAAKPPSGVRPPSSVKPPSGVRPPSEGGVPPPPGVKRGPSAMRLDPDAPEVDDSDDELDANDSGDELDPMESGVKEIDLSGSEPKKPEEAAKDDAGWIDWTKIRKKKPGQK